MKKVLITFLLLVPIGLCALAQTRPRAKTTASAATAASISRGLKVYTQYCLACHQADGGGVPNMNPPLSKTSYVSGDKVRLIKVVLNGFPSPVDIDGESYTNNMPPHNFLKDQDIADVLTYVRNNFGNKGTAVTATQVKMVRAKN